MFDSLKESVAMVETLKNNGFKTETMALSPAIFKAIPEIMKEMDPVAKGQTNKEQGYKFRGIDDIYNELQKTMARHGVFTVPTIVGRSRKDIVSKNGAKGVHTLNNYVFRFYADDGSFIEAQTDGECIEYGDKGSNKSAAIAHKYALLQVFCIPTADKEGEEKDPDFLAPSSFEDKKQWFDYRNYVVDFGKSHNGVKFINIPDSEKESYAKTLSDNYKAPQPPHVRKYLDMVNQYFDDMERGDNSWADEVTV